MIKHRKTLMSDFSEAETPADFENSEIPSTVASPSKMLK
jgi:hypothetical protein